MAMNCFFPHSSSNGMQERVDAVEELTRDFTATLGSHASTDTVVFFVGKPNAFYCIGGRGGRHRLEEEKIKVGSLVSIIA